MHWGGGMQAVPEVPHSSIPTNECESTLHEVMQSFSLTTTRGKGKRPSLEAPISPVHLALSSKLTFGSEKRRRNDRNLAQPGPDERALLLHEIPEAHARVVGEGDADADHLDLGHALSPSRSRSAEGNGVFYSDDGRQYGMRAILARATAGHYEACAATLRGNIRALDFISDEMTRLRAQLKSGELSDVRLTYFELEGLTIAMESHLEWAQGNEPEATEAFVSAFATLWTATLRSLAATQQAEDCNLRQTLHFVNSLAEKAGLGGPSGGLGPIEVVLTKMVSLRKES